MRAGARASKKKRKEKKKRVFRGAAKSIRSEEQYLPRHQRGRGEPMDEKGWLGERHPVYLAVKFYSNPRGHGSRGPFPFSIPTGKTRRDETRAITHFAAKLPSRFPGNSPSSSSLSSSFCSSPNFYFPSFGLHLPPYVYIRACTRVYVCTRFPLGRWQPGGGGLSSIYRKHDLYIDVAGYAQPHPSHPTDLSLSLFSLSLSLCTANKGEEVVLRPAEVYGGGGAGAGSMKPGQHPLLLRPASLSYVKIQHPFTRF